MAYSGIAFALCVFATSDVPVVVDSAIVLAALSEPAGGWSQYSSSNNKIKEPYIGVEWLAFRRHIREVPSSNLGAELP
jgi:hypothetical protein